MILLIIGFGIGLIIGLLLCAILLLLYSRKESTIVKYLDRTLQNKERAQFFEPISFDEKFKNAENVSDLLTK